MSGKMSARKPITERVADDLGGAFTVGLAYIGDRLGLFAALAGLGRSSSVGVAQRTGLQERYVREWLNAMVASEYIEYDPDEKSYFLTPEQDSALVDEAARTFVGGAFGFALGTNEIGQIQNPQGTTEHRQPHGVRDDLLVVPAAHHLAQKVHVAHGNLQGRSVIAAAVAIRMVMA
jgi:hypothetical protein